MQQAYGDIRKMVLHTQAMVTELENGENTTMELQGEISSNVNTLDRLLVNLQQLTAAYDGADQNTWRIKVENETASVKELRDSITDYMSTQWRRQTEVREREELFRRVHGSANAREADERAEKEGEAYDRMNQEADRLLDSGSNILGSLYEQREMLKSIKRKVLSVTNTLGLTRSLMMVIERRQAGDKLIVYGGMVVTFLLLILFYYYFRM